MNFLNLFGALFLYQIPKARLFMFSLDILAQ
jgi:hypothetical protein